jgi:hypothetical protein
VSIASPVAVPDEPEPAPLPLLPLDDDERERVVALDDADEDVVVAADAVALTAAGARWWKARTPAVPAIVAARTMGDRRMLWLRVRR